MRAIILALAGALTLSAAAAAQHSIPKSETLQAKEANVHYQRGWEAMRGEQWDQAVSEFKRTIEIDPQFELAYYSLGRAHMGQRAFAKAIAAYIECRDRFVRHGGERFSNDLDARRRIEDRMLEYQAALSQARTSGN